MGITVYSLAISIVFYNLALIAVFILRRSPGFRARHAVSLLAFITVLGVVRLVLPIDFDAAYVVRSYTIIPAIEDFLKRPLAASFAYGHLLLALWAVGSLVMVIKDVRLQQRFDRYLQSIDFVDRPELLEIAAEYGSNFAVLISPQLNMPFTSGILHPVIYLPDVELSDAEWRMVFCHEITHIRSRDNLKKLFFLAVEALFWWNPLAHFSAAEINALIELRCDAMVTEKMNRVERLAYTELLRRLMGTAYTGEAFAFVSNMIGSNTEMHLRFEALGNDHSEHGFTRHIFYYIACLLLIASYFLLVQSARVIDQDHAPILDEGYVVSYSNIDIQAPSDMYLYLVDGQYYLYINGDNYGLVHEENLLSPPVNNLPIIEGD